MSNLSWNCVWCLALVWWTRTIASSYPLSLVNFKGLSSPPPPSSTAPHQTQKSVFCKMKFDNSVHPGHFPLTPKKLYFGEHTHWEEKLQKDLCLKYSTICFPIPPFLFIEGGEFWVYLETCLHVLWFIWPVLNWRRMRRVYIFWVSCSLFCAYCSNRPEVDSCRSDIKESVWELMAKCIFFPLWYLVETGFWSSSWILSEDRSS